MGFLSGLRDGELAGLSVTDFVDANDVAALKVTKALALVGSDGMKQIQSPKNENSVRTVPLHPLATEALRWWVREGWGTFVGRKPTSSDALFPDERGRRSRPRSAEKLRDDLETAGLPTTFEGHNIVFHSTRASFCTQLEEEDASEPVKSRLMGQGAGTVADSHYTSKSFRRLRQAVESLKLNVTLADITSYERPARKPRRPTSETARPP